MTLIVAPADERGLQASVSLVAPTLHRDEDCRPDLPTTAVIIVLLNIDQTDRDANGADIRVRKNKAQGYPTQFGMQLRSILPIFSLV